MKPKIVIIGVVLLIGIFFGGTFAYRNLRGSRPAFGPVPKITQPPDAINSTGLPLQLPPGFSISLFAKNVPNARVLVFDPGGALLVSLPSQGKVVVASDNSVVADGLTSPHGLAFHNEKLYIAETNQVAMYDYDQAAHKASNKKKLFDLPSGGNHFSRTIGFGSDGKLYVSVGSSCNVCYETDERRAKILVANADGSDLKPFASGLRNSVFFVWHPKTSEMWATEMGRDLLGDNIPPEEINIITQNANYGWPYCYSNKLHDNNFDPKQLKNCDTTIAPYITFQAHSAPLGLAFIPDSWPTEYRGDLLVSYHGSWNRSEPTGYKVVRFDLDNGNKELDFLTGFLQGDSAVGRPVDLIFDQRGNLYISDDKAGTIYKVSVL